MNDYDTELIKRVDRKYKPLMRVIWSGFLSLIIWGMLILGWMVGALSGELGLLLGFLTLLIPAAAGILFAQEMIKIGMFEEEEKRMAELGLKEKRKHSAGERLGLSDDGELIEYGDYEDDALSEDYA